MAQQVINVGAAPNDGTGDPIRTAYIKTNSNFGELYNRVQTNPPSSLEGSIGDTAGMYAYDSNYFYYCYANFTGNTQIWNQITNTGNVSVTNIASGNSSIAFNNVNGNALVSVRGVSNVAVFSNVGLTVSGAISSTGAVTAAANVNAANIYVSGQIVSNNNITGQYFVGNGAYLTGISTTYGNSNVATYLPTYSGGFPSLLGNVVTTANVSGTYILGNGSQLTGLPATYGNSNVATYLPTYSGNLNPGNLSTTGIISSTGNISSAGNISGTYILGNGSHLTGLPATYGNSNVATYLPTYSGNLNPGNISASGNITGAYILGNGSQLTGLPANYGNIQVASYLPTYTGSFASLTGNVTTTANISAGNVLQNGVRVYNYSTGNSAPANPVAGDNWWYTAGNVLYQYINDGVNSQWVDVFDPSFPPASISVAANTIAQRDANGNLSANVFAGTTVSVSGNVSGNYILGNGSQLTGITASLSGNISSANVTYAASYANAITRTQAVKNTDVISVKDFGATGNGTTDDTAAIQAAINYAVATRNIGIYIPAGKYKLTSALSVNGGSGTQVLNIDVYGDGHATQLLQYGNNATFSFTGLIYNVSFRDFDVPGYYTGSTPNNAIFYFPGGNCNSYFENITSLGNNKLASFYVCAANATNDTVSFNNCIAAIDFIGYQFGAGSSIFITGGRMIGTYPASNISIGLYLTGGLGGLWVWGTDFINHSIAIDITADGGTNNREIFFTQTSVDSSNIGLNIVDDSYVNWEGCWASACNNININFAPATDTGLLNISGGSIFNSGNLGSGTTGSMFGLSINQYGRLLMSGVNIRNNNGRGVSFNNGSRTQQAIIEGCSFTDNGNTSVSGSCQLYATGAMTLKGNYFNTSTVPSVTIDESHESSMYISDNIGFTGFGLRTSPLAIGSSNTTVTNTTGQRINMYLRLGTVQSVWLNGNPVYDYGTGASADCMLILNPSDTFKVVYSVIPNVQWYYD